MYLSNVFNRRSPEKRAVDESDEISILNGEKQAKRRDKNINHLSGSLLLRTDFSSSLQLFRLALGVNRETFLRILFLV